MLNLFGFQLTNFIVANHACWSTSLYIWIQKTSSLKPYFV